MRQRDAPFPELGGAQVAGSTKGPNLTGALAQRRSTIAGASSLHPADDAGLGGL
jgi:hypothetical protein